MSSQSANSGAKPADYVYFERTTAGFSEDALPRSKAAQLKLEHYYKVAVEAAIERNQRCVVCVCFCGVPFTASISGASFCYVHFAVCGLLTAYAMLWQACGGRAKACS